MKTFKNTSTVQPLFLFFFIITLFSCNNNDFYEINNNRKSSTITSRSINTQIDTTINKSPFSYYPPSISLELLYKSGSGLIYSVEASQYKYIRRWKRTCLFPNKMPPRYKSRQD